MPAAWQVEGEWQKAANAALALVLIAVCSQSGCTPRLQMPHDQRKWVFLPGIFRLTARPNGLPFSWATHYDVSRVGGVGFYASSQHTQRLLVPRIAFQMGLSSSRGVGSWHDLSSPASIDSKFENNESVRCQNCSKMCLLPPPPLHSPSPGVVIQTVVLPGLPKANMMYDLCMIHISKMAVLCWMAILFLFCFIKL